VVVAVIAVAQVGVIVRDEVAVVHAARAGARAAAVAADPASTATRAASAATRLPITVTTSIGSEAVTVTVSYVDSTNAPIIGGLFQSVTHLATATMPLEPP